MTETKAAIAVALVLILPVQSAGAQLVSRFEAGAITSTRDGALPENVLALRPAIEFDHPLLALSASGAAWRTRESWQLGGGHARGSISTPEVFGLRGEISGSANRIAYDASIHSDQFDARARVHMRVGRGGFWFGGGLDRPVHVPVISSVEVTGGGAWTRVGRATLTTTVTSFFFTKVAAASDSIGAISCTASTDVSGPGLDQSVRPTVVVDQAVGNGAPSECRRESRFSDVEGAVEWSFGPIELAAQGGYRIGGSYDVTPESRRWAAATATYWLSGQLAAVIGGGRQPANPARGLPARSYANLGVMLAYWPIPKRRVPVASSATVSAFDVRDAGASQQTLVVRVGGVERVEVMGDFTAWEPKLLTRIGRDRWEITLPITPGIHQVNIRVDNGRWRPP
ncbi:MAG: hypothetical protein M3303_15190, partial [Gemmatimonadota bacterium]|nr:hypothetical protein [Gemmatimonadota bacterium]